MEVERRIVKSPFTKEQREGVFVTIEESRNRRKDMSIGMSPKEAQETIKSQNEYIMQLSKEKCSLQAKIDALMLEFCPQEMTKQQIERWEESQAISQHPNKGV